MTLADLTDDEGYLCNLDDWNPTLAEAIAERDGITLTSDHWEIMDFFRDYYQEYAITPARRVLSKKLGKDKANVQRIYTLFTDSPSKQICKLAGLPKPTRCI